MSKYWLYLIYFSCIKPKFSDDLKLYSRFYYKSYADGIDLTDNIDRQGRLGSLTGIFRGNAWIIARCFGHQPPLDAAAVFGEKHRG